MKCECGHYKAQHLREINFNEGNVYEDCSDCDCKQFKEKENKLK